MAPFVAAIRPHAKEWTPAILLFPALLVLGIFVAVPLLGIIRVSVANDIAGDGFTLDNYTAIVTDPFYIGVFIDTALTGLGVTVVALLIGYPIALYVGLGAGIIRRYVVFAVLSPLLISVVVRAYALAILIGPNNPIEQLLGSDHDFSLLFTRAGVIVGLVYTLMPFMVLSIIASVSSIDPRLLAAARSLGASSWAVLWRIILPLSAPGLMAGSLVVFTLAITSFALPLLLGGTRYKMAVSFIWEQLLVLFNWPFGYAISLVLLLLAALTLYAATRFSARTKGAFLQ